MSKFKHTIEEKADGNVKNIADVISRLAVKHEVNVESIMVGFVCGDKKELYVWNWEPGRSMDEQFRVLEIINLL
jgi:hypothetical protein